MVGSASARAALSERSRPRARLSGFLAASLVAAAAVLAIGAWMIAGGLSARALIGQPVAHSGGTVTVLAAWTMDDPMRLMHPDDPERFAASGMQAMSAMLSDPVPEGRKRVSVELALLAGETAMRFPLVDVSLTADGVAYPVYSSMLDDEELGPGHALSAVAIFEVPVETGVAEFRLGSRTTPIAIDVAGTPGGHVVHDTDE